MAERHIWTKRKTNMMWIYRKRFWMPLHDTSSRKSAVSMKVRKDRRFTRNGLRNIPNTQKSEKVRWGRGDLSGLFLLTTLSEPYLHGETAVKEICVRPMSIWQMTQILIQMHPLLGLGGALLLKGVHFSQRGCRQCKEVHLRKLTTVQPFSDPGNQLLRRWHFTFARDLRPHSTS